MSYFTNLVANISEGAYLSALKNESSERAKNSVWYRIMTLAFLYYISVVIFSIGLIVSTIGPFKLSFIESITFIFIPFFVLYRLGIYPHINTKKFENNQTEKEKQERIKLYLYIFIGSVISVLTALILVYFMYKIEL